MSRNGIVIAALAAFVATGCFSEEYGLPEGGAGELSDWQWEITQQQCKDDVSVPFTDDQGQPCNLPADETTCQSIDWDSENDPDKDHACFGFGTDLEKCENCNILNLPDSGPTAWNECRNQQYMDCLMNGHLGDYGDMCFVTKPGDINHDKNKIPVTSKEFCYYYKKKGKWPPQCGEGAQCDEEN